MIESAHTSITNVLSSSITQLGQEQQVPQQQLVVEDIRDPHRYTINQDMTSLPEKLCC